MCGGCGGVCGVEDEDEGGDGDAGEEDGDERGGAVEAALVGAQLLADHPGFAFVLPPHRCSDALGRIGKWGGAAEVLVRH